MKKFMGLFLIIVSLTWCLPYASFSASQENYAALNKGSKKEIYPQDKELVNKYQDFENFAKWKVRELNNNHRLSRSRMQIIKQADGTYLARYHEIDDKSLSYRVRRSSSSSAPFVGILSFHEEIYESSGRDPKKFRDDSFAVVKIIPNRHIFSFQKGEWK